ncbi:DsbA family protein [Haloarchaeobius sp. TZWWS8]|uniref:DsbA family protein n=1 Tax=Haloarchaeobius sp. TZWWS8 TaxID=3446121 RepID=UPI003EB892E2
MTDRTTRRRLLAGLGCGVVASLSGCTNLVNATSDGNPSADTVAKLAVPTLGVADAPVTLASFSDYQCGHCSTYHVETVPQVYEKYIATGKVRYEQHDFPLPLNEWSWDVPLAARSVQATAGDEAFFEFSKGAFAAQKEMSWETIRSLARKVGADPETVVTDAKNATYYETVEADRKLGESLGVEGTPTFFVNGHRLEPEQSWWYTVDTGLQAALQEE